MCDAIRPTTWFLFLDNLILLRKKGAEFAVPEGEQPPYAVSQSIEVPFNDTAIGYAARLECLVEEDALYAIVDLRASLDLIGRDMYLKAGKAFHLLYWNDHSRYCPACATPNEHLLPIMKKCPKCGHEQFPVIAPAIIVLICKGDEILLVRARNFRGAHHGLVAGFLEPGETLEECVEREVMEETGLSIKNIRYWGNQPWPYPSGLMVGYIADYAGGEITLQEEELESAAFYSKENLPEIPLKASLARHMIDWWLSGANLLPQNQP